MTIIRDVREALNIFNSLDRDEWIGIDLETTGLSPWRDKITVVSLYSRTKDTAAVLHQRHQIDADLIKYLGSNRKFITYNGVNFDIPFLANSGVRVFENQWYDAFVGESVILTTGRKNVRRDLSSTLKRRLGTHTDKKLQTSNWNAEELSAEQVTYAANDVCHLPALRDVQLEKINGTTQVKAMDVEQRLVPIIVTMRLNGLPVDFDKLKQYLALQQNKIVQTRAFLNKILGPINVQSSAQVKRALQQTFKIELSSTDKNSLVELEEAGGQIAEVARHILMLRQAEDRAGMYDRTWQDKYIQPDGCIHPELWQLGTDTGRFTCSDPNGQQSPRDMRHIYGGKPEHKVLSIDYSQIEVWAAAAIANDENLLHDLRSEDIHTMIASWLFDISTAQVTEEYRRLAKAAVFTLCFCGGIKSIIRRASLGGTFLDEDQANEIKTKFLQRYPKIENMRQMAYRLADSKQPVVLTMPHGLKRVLFPPVATVIVNNIVQGSAASGLKYGLLEIDRLGLTRYLCMTMHDENVFIVPDNMVEEVKSAAVKAMLDGMEKAIGVRAAVKTKIGTHWQ